MVLLFFLLLRDFFLNRQTSGLPSEPFISLTAYFLISTVSFLRRRRRNAAQEGEKYEEEVKNVMKEKKEQKERGKRGGGGNDTEIYRT